MEKNRSEVIIVIGSNPKLSKGGAGKIISSYIDHYKRLPANYFFLTIHKMYPYKILRYSPILFSSLKAIWIRLKFGKKNIVIHHHHDKLIDMFSLLTFKIILGVNKNKCLITFHNSKHFEKFSSLKNVTQKNNLKTKFFISLHLRLISLLSHNYHLLNSFNCNVIKEVIGQNKFFHLAQNPLSDAQIKKLKTNIINNEGENFSKNKVIGTFGFMREIKRLDRAIEMIKELPKNYSLLIGGIGPQEKYLKEFTIKLGLESRVTFLGWLDDDRKKTFFKSIDLFLITSDFETESLVFLEAILNCKPIVSVPTKSLIEIYPRDICAIYSEDSHPKSLAKTVLNFKKNKLSSSKASQHILDQRINTNYAEILFK
tara:strand:- start:834 stop:1943 length:1110 start_codon:yes stop_codon:yes gene_type:complete